MNESASEVETIFLAARDVSQPGEREAYLARVCGENRNLRQRVERMLHAEEQADQFLADNPLELTESPLATAGPAEKPGTMIGRYKLLQKIGEGGCGVVYMAEQEEPIRRRVAVKVIKLGMDTEQVVARFEAERQALAMMDHPNIARVLDAGATDAGRPYFVMELVRGIRITEYCDQNNLSTGERLGLFISVAQAIQHAHQKGIIHRDIKPSNVLVTLHDGVPVPKVIDFGVAKAIEQKLTDKTLFTQFEQFIGTPAYTSPEQAEMSGLDIDTRSDIYSLGVLLYELLVGKTPFESQELVRSGLNEMRRLIREKEPSRPSTVLSTMLAQERTATALRRGASAPELAHQLKGDLDWIVMKCLEKDRTRRYESASGLATDIRNYLSHETVTARPPTAAYRFGKTVRRHKLAFAASAAVVLALVAGIVASTWQAARAWRAEQASRRAEETANEEKESAEAVLKFVRDNILAAGRPEGQEGGLGKDVTLRKAIDAAESKISETFKDRPLVEAAIRKTIGESYGYLGEPALAVPQLERAFALRQDHFGLLHERTESALDSLHLACVAMGQPDRCLPLFEEILELCKIKFGRDHPTTIADMGGLGLVYAEAGMYDRAVTHLEETVPLMKDKLGPGHFLTLVAMNNLGLAYLNVGKLDQAEALFKETIDLRRAGLREEYDSINTMQNLVVVYQRSGRRDEAMTLAQEMLELTKAKRGPEHPDTLERMHEVANAFLYIGKPEQSATVFKETLRLRTEKLGPEHPKTLSTMEGLAVACLYVDKGEQGVAFVEETLKVRRATQGPEHPDTLTAIDRFAWVYQDLGKPDEAEALYRENLRLMKDDPTATLGLARALSERAGTDPTPASRRQERVAEILRLTRDGLAQARSRYANDPEELEYKLSDVVEIYYRQNLYAEAEPLYREILKNRPNHITATASLARLLADWAWADRGSKSEMRNLKPETVERAREAERLLRDCLTKRLADTGGKEEWRVADVKSRLGGALVSVAVTDSSLDAAAREATLDEAESLLLEGHQEMHENMSVAAKYRRDALERVVRLYDARGEPDKLAEWRRKLADFDKPGSDATPAVVEKQ